MEKNIKLVKVRSELGAGTRGASLGVGALRTACLDLGSDYFTRFDEVNVPVYNDALFEEPSSTTAKYIESIYKTLDGVSDHVAEVLKSGEFPLVLAGDHSTAAGTIAGIKKADPQSRLGVIWIDAHADLQTPYTSDTGNMHGMPLAMAINEDNLDEQVNDPEPHVIKYWEKLKALGIEGQKVKPTDIVFIGGRSIDEAEEVLMDRFGITNITVEEMRKKGIKETVKQTLELLKDCSCIYISFDVDSMDAKVSMGTGTPVKHGLKVEEAKELNALLVQNNKVCCYEMVEVNPTLDTENRMAEVAFEILDNTTDALQNR